MQLEMRFPEMVEGLERKYGSLSAASRKADIPHTTLAKIKSGATANPRWDTIVKIADGLGIPLKELIEEEARHVAA